MIGAVGTRRFPAFARSELADGGGRACVQRPIRFMRPGLWMLGWAGKSDPKGSFVGGKLKKLLLPGGHPAE